MQDLLLSLPAIAAAALAFCANDLAARRLAFNGHVFGALFVFVFGFCAVLAVAAFQLETAGLFFAVVLGCVFSASWTARHSAKLST